MTVTITSPVDGVTLSGAVIWAVASNTPANSCYFFIDGRTYAVVYTTPFYTSVATPALSNGSHVWMAICYDSTGAELGRLSITVTTSNPDTTSPITTITSPLTGATVKDTIPVAIRATDTNGISKVSLYCDGSILGSDTVPEYDPAVNKNARYIINFDTTKFINGFHTLLAKAYDVYGNVGQRSITVNVANATTDSTPPNLTVNIPQAITGTLPLEITLSGTASDTSGIAKIEVDVDGGIKTLATGNTSWSANVSIATIGNHVITVKATDGAGNTSLKSIACSLSQLVTALFV